VTPVVRRRTVRALRSQIAAREQHPAPVPPPPIRVGYRLAAWMQAQGCDHTTMARSAGLTEARLTAILAGQTPAPNEARALATAIGDERLVEAAADERLRAGR